MQFYPFLPFPSFHPLNPLPLFTNSLPSWSLFLSPSLHCVPPSLSFLLSFFLKKKKKRKKTSSNQLKYSWCVHCANRLHENTIKQWDILDQRLSLPGQHYIALKDRPTLADLSYFPFAMPWMFAFLGVDIKDWPAIESWSRRMLEREAVRQIMERAKRFGH